MEDLRTSEEWQKVCKITIFDPDGWDRTANGWEFSWHEEKITRAEFERRMIHSTCRFPAGSFEKGYNMWKDK